MLRFARPCGSSAAGRRAGIVPPSLQLCSRSSSRLPIIRARGMSSTPPPPPAAAAAATATTAVAGADVAQPGWVRTMNHAIEEYRWDMAAAFMLGDAGSIITMYWLTDSVLHIQVPVDFAVAFAISRLLRRVRLPIDAGVAALLARAVPSLTQVHMSRLFKKKPAAGSTAAGSATRELGAPIGGSVPTSRWGRAVGLAAIFGIYAALRAGVDVQSLLAAVNIDASNIGAAAGKWAAAACLAAPFFPGVVYGAAVAAPRIAGARRALVSTFRKPKA
ncbi:hypothetical protein EON68_01155 [archaeon]|nr:MAG: hypothetical protein EON68_01155 [archaeon]